MANPQKLTDVKLMVWEKEKIRKNVIRRARAQCSEDFKAYVDCMDNNVITGAWRCRKAMYILNDCLNQYTTDADFERETLAQIAERQNLPPEHPLSPHHKEWQAKQQAAEGSK